MLVTPLGRGGAAWAGSSLVLRRRRLRPRAACVQPNPLV